jgi:hypothetical protein
VTLSGDQGVNLDVERGAGAITLGFVGLQPDSSWGVALARPALRELSCSSAGCGSPFETSRRRGKRATPFADPPARLA